MWGTGSWTSGTEPLQAWEQRQHLVRRSTNANRSVCHKLYILHSFGGSVKWKTWPTMWAWLQTGRLKRNDGKPTNLWSWNNVEDKHWTVRHDVNRQGYDVMRGLCDKLQKILRMFIFNMANILWPQIWRGYIRINLGNYRGRRFQHCGFTHTEETSVWSADLKSVLWSRIRG